MDLGKPLEVVEVDLNPADTPPTALPDPEPEAAPAPAEREEELVPAGVEP